MKTALRGRPPIRARVASPSPNISVIVEEILWREDKQVLPLIRRAVRLTLAQIPRRDGMINGRSIAILLSDDSRLQGLNTLFRGLDKPTNVLSFPPAAGGEPYLGDVALAYGLVSREARAQQKSFPAHAAHLVIHGVLHLLGFDHEKASDARLMEQQEVFLLAQLAIGDPYAPRPCTAGGKAA